VNVPPVPRACQRTRSRPVLAMNGSVCSNPDPDQRPRGCQTVTSSVCAGVL
jgi:hypothetical protein